jgi:hypothetical protein
VFCAAAGAGSADYSLMVQGLGKMFVGLGLGKSSLGYRMGENSLGKDWEHVHVVRGCTLSLGIAGRTSWPLLMVIFSLPSFFFLHRRGWPRVLKVCMGF